MTDFSGVRIVCFYPDDLPKIERLIGEEFDVVGKEGLESKEIDRFGYMPHITWFG